MTIKTELPMFATANDTPFWAVMVDGRVGLFVDRADAERVYDLIGGDSDLGGTPFGACQLVSPGYRPINRFDGSDMSKANVSQVRPIDIEGYIVKRPQRGPWATEDQTEWIRPVLQRRLAGEAPMFTWSSWL